MRFRLFLLLLAIGITVPLRPVDAQQRGRKILVLAASSDSRGGPPRNHELLSKSIDLLQPHLQRLGFEVVTEEMLSTPLGVARRDAAQVDRLVQLVRRWNENSDSLSRVHDLALVQVRYEDLPKTSPPGSDRAVRATMNVKIIDLVRQVGSAAVWVDKDLPSNGTCGPHCAFQVISAKVEMLTNEIAPQLAAQLQAGHSPADRSSSVQAEAVSRSCDPKEVSSKGINEDLVIAVSCATMPPGSLLPQQSNEISTFIQRKLGVSENIDHLLRNGCTQMKRFDKDEQQTYIVRLAGRDCLA